MTDLTVILNHYEAISILIDYVKKRKAEGDKEATQALRTWDRARGCITP